MLTNNWDPTAGHPVRLRPRRSARWRSHRLGPHTGPRPAPPHDPHTGRRPRRPSRPAPRPPHRTPPLRPLPPRSRTPHRTPPRSPFPPQSRPRLRRYRLRRNLRHASLNALKGRRRSPLTERVSDAAKGLCPPRDPTATVAPEPWSTHADGTPGRAQREDTVGRREEGTSARGRRRTH